MLGKITVKITISEVSQKFKESYGKVIAGLLLFFIQSLIALGVIIAGHKKL